MKKLLYVAVATVVLASCSGDGNSGLAEMAEMSELASLTSEEKEQMKVLEEIFEKYEFKRDPAVPYEEFARHWIEIGPDSAYIFLSTLDSLKRGLLGPVSVSLSNDSVLMR